MFLHNRKICNHKTQVRIKNSPLGFLMDFDLALTAHQASAFPLSYIHKRIIDRCGNN